MTMQSTDKAAYSSLLLHFGDLSQSPFDPLNVAGELFAAGIIGDATLFTARQATTNPVDRRMEIVQAVMANGKADVFQTFVQVLMKEKQNSSICEKLIATYKGKGGVWVEDTTSKGGVGVGVPKPATSRTASKLGETVDLTVLTCFKYHDSRGEQRMFIVDDMAHRWKQVGHALKFSQPDIENIEITCRGDVVTCCGKLFAQWLGGYANDKDSRPKTWETLLDVMRDARLEALADKLKTILTS